MGLGMSDDGVQRFARLSKIQMTKKNESLLFSLKYFFGLKGGMDSAFFVSHSKWLICCCLSFKLSFSSLKYSETHLI